MPQTTYTGTVVGEITNIQVSKDSEGGYFGFIIFKHEGAFTYYTITSDFEELANKMAGKKVKLGYKDGDNTLYNVVTSIDLISK